jgi:drug/metabolite transporter (DMT)-like permease
VLGGTKGRDAALIWAALATVYLVWGSTYLGIAVAIRGLPPFLMSGVRFLVAGAVLYAWARRRGAPRPSAQQWLAAGVVGFALLLVGNGGIAWAEQRIESGVTALLVATTPLWMAILDWIFHGRRLSARGLAGLLVGLGGVVLLVGGPGHVDLVGSIVVVLASLAWAAGSLYARTGALPSQPLLSAGMQMLTASVLLGVAGASSGELGRVSLPHVSTASIVAFGYLVVVGSLLTYTAYGWLLRSSAPTALVGTYAYVNPVVAVVLGALFLREPLTTRTLLAGLAILGSVALTVSRGSRFTAADQPETAPARVGRLVLDRPVQTVPSLVDLRRAAA